MNQIDMSQIQFYQPTKPKPLIKSSNPITSNPVETIHKQSEEAIPITFNSQLLPTIESLNNSCSDILDNQSDSQDTKQEMLLSSEDCIVTGPIYPLQLSLDKHQDVNDNSSSIEQIKEQCGTKTKRHLLTTTDQSRKRRRVKRHRFSSPFSSDGMSELEPDNNPCPTSLSSSRLTSSSAHSPSTNLCEQQDERLSHRMTVIYEQKHWEGVIIDERDEKQGRGRPRKQYLVKWKSSWVDGAVLATPALLQQWRDTKRSRNDC